MASKIIVDQLEKTGGSLTALTLPTSNASASQYLQNDGAGALSWATVSIPAGGKVLQVLFDGTSANWSSTSGTYADTDLSVSITPASSSNKVLVIVAGNYGRANQTNSYGMYKLLRDSTSLAEGPFTDQYGPALGSLAVTILDEPATTSALIYKVQAAVDYTGGSMTMYFPQATGTTTHGSVAFTGYASITVMEIAA